MAVSKYLADTNAFIYLLQKHPSISPLLQGEWYYSFITAIELLGKTGIKRTEIKLIRSMLTTANKIQHSEAITEEAIYLRQRYKIKTPDAIIAATALNLSMPLLTADIGFIRIKLLDVVLIEL